MSDRPVQILLVEDDAAHAEIVRRNLSGLPVPHRIVHLTDGQQALDYLQRRNGYAGPNVAARPDIVLLDLRLPRIDGLEVLRVVKEDPALQSIPVVVLTTSAAEADRALAYGRRANSYLVKPVELARFTELMTTFGLYWLTWNTFPG